MNTFRTDNLNLIIYCCVLLWCLLPFKFKEKNFEYMLYWRTRKKYSMQPFLESFNYFENIYGLIRLLVWNMDLSN
jgi:hypothetical protein